MNFYEKTIESNKIFSGNIIDVYLDKIILPNGNKASREVVSHPGGVCIAAINKNNQIYFVRQYRYPKHEVILELPAGKLEKNLSILENAKKELKEEVGVIGKDFTYLGKAYASPGISNEDLHMYFCKVEKLVKPTPDDGEFLEPLLIDLKEALDMVMDNKIHDAKTQLTTLKLCMFLKLGL